jgi:hypothetical protein
MTTTPADMALFVGLSSVLTGIDKAKLAPALDPNNIKQVFYDCASQEGGALFTQLLGVYGACQAEPDAQVAQTVFQRSGPALCYLARAIMLSWYLGSWYRPGDLQQAQEAEPAPPETLPPLSGAVISAAAYTQGWAWNIAQAHPMGYSNFSFGYWARQPPALADFTGEPQ